MQATFAAARGRGATFRAWPPALGVRPVRRGVHVEKPSDGGFEGRRAPRAPGPAREVLRRGEGGQVELSEERSHELPTGGVAEDLRELVTCCRYTAWLMPFFRASPFRDSFFEPAPPPSPAVS